MSVDALQNALSGLRIAQKQLDVASRNVANVQTPGYTRKILPLESFVAGNSGAGVVAGNVQRQVDQYLQRDLWAQTGDAQRLNTMSSYLGKVQQVYGTPDSETSLAADLANLQNTFVQLSGNANSSILQKEAVTRATNFSKSINDLANYIQQLRNQTQSDMAGAVSTANESLDKIAKLNKQIAAEVSAGGTAPDLEDQRDEAVNTLAGLMNISFFKRPDGVMVVQTREGRFLADTTSAHISFDSGTPLGPSSYYGGTGTVNGVILGTGVASFDMSSSNPSGKLGALLELRDKLLPQMQAQLDEMAYQTANAFATAIDPTTGLALFVDSTEGVPAADPTQPPPAGYAGFAQQIKVAATILADPTIIQSGTGTPPPTLGGLGDPAVITAVLNKTFGGQRTFTINGLGADGQLTSGLPQTTNILDYVQQMISKQANDKDIVDSRSLYETNFRDALSRKLQDDSGVNLDNETAAILVVQKAYAAAAQVISTTTKMMDDLLAAMR